MTQTGTSYVYYVCIYGYIDTHRAYICIYVSTDNTHMMYLSGSSISLLDPPLVIYVIYYLYSLCTIVSRSSPSMSQY